MEVVWCWVTGLRLEPHEGGVHMPGACLFGLVGQR